VENTHTHTPSKKTLKMQKIHPRAQEAVKSGMLALSAAFVVKTTTAVGSTARLEQEKATVQMCTTFDVSCEANLSHVVIGAACIIQTSDLPMAVTKVFIRMKVNDFVMVTRMSAQRRSNSSTPRNLSAIFPHKNGAE
jgi:hypothetical protein